jgi:hypothetical protein
MKSSTICICVATFLILCLIGNGVLADCPPCDLAQVSMDGSGSAPDNRTLAQIYIEHSWDIDSNGNSISGTNSEIWNAVVGYHDPNVNLTGATELWNNATSGTNHAPYYFQVNQSFFSHTDIYISRVDNPSGGCADIAWTQVDTIGRCG